MRGANRAAWRTVTCGACGEATLSTAPIPAGWTAGKGGGVRCPDCPGKRLTTPALQCQVEAARFASTADVIDEIRATTARTAIRLLRAGDRPGALAAMYEGLAAQAPLTFKPPTVVTA